MKLMVVREDVGGQESERISSQITEEIRKEHGKPEKLQCAEAS
jgi:hypothetical protein